MFSYILLVGLVVAIQAGLCSTSAPLTSSVPMTERSEDLDFDEGFEKYDKLSKAPVGAIAGMKPSKKFGVPVTAAVRIADGAMKNPAGPSTAATTTSTTTYTKKN